MTTARLLIRQLRYERLAFTRNPAAAFFTFFFPLIFLVIFNVIFGNEPIDIEGGRTNTSTFYIPTIAAFSVINACYTGLAMSIAFARDQGQLKRVAGTPLPKGAYLGAKVLFMTLIAILLVIVVTAFGLVFYGVDVPSGTMPAFLLSLVVGAAAFAALGSRRPRSSPTPRPRRPSSTRSSCRCSSSRTSSSRCARTRRPGSASPATCSRQAPLDRASGGVQPVRAGLWSYASAISP